MKARSLLLLGLGLVSLLIGRPAEAQVCPSLPCDMSADSPGGVLSVVNTGQGGAASFQNSVSSTSPTVAINSDGSGTALFGRNRGLGGAAQFQIPGRVNPSDAVLIDSISAQGRGVFAMLTNPSASGAAIQAENWGLGVAGLFRTTNAASQRPAFGVLNAGSSAGTLLVNTSDANRAAAMMAYTSGLGTAGGFLSTHQQNTNPTLLAGTVGQNSAAQFVALNPANLRPGIDVTSYGQGSAIRAWSDAPDSVALEAAGNGSAIAARVDDPKSEGTALTASTWGRGGAAWFRVVSGSDADAVTSIANGTGRALVAGNFGTGDALYGAIPEGAADGPMQNVTDGGRAAVRGVTFARTGNAGVFQIANPSNINPAVWAYAPGDAIVADGGRALRATGEVKISGYTDIWHEPLALRVFNQFKPGTVALFIGDVEVSGYFWSGGKGFRIDDPVDPENMYLNHVSVESPEMMTVYAGVALLDSKGEARVQLPRYFEALNRDFRYQLTPIGGAAPNLHVATKLSDNAFTIGGGTAGLEVSWQVMGVRKDPYAERHRVSAEVQKEAGNRGRYLHPEEWGKSPSEGIVWNQLSREEKEDADAANVERRTNADRAHWADLVKRIAEDDRRVSILRENRRVQRSAERSAVQAQIAGAEKLVRELVPDAEPKGAPPK